MSAAPLPTVSNPGGIANVLQLIQALQGSFGSGKTKATQGGTSVATQNIDDTQTQTKSLDPGASAQADQLMALISGQNDSNEMDQMVQNILTRAKQEFAPVVGRSAAAGERVTGAYTPTVVAQLGNEAMARATAEAAGKKLEFINKNNALATQIVDTKLRETGTQTTQRKATNTTTTQSTGNTNTQTGATPFGKALGYAGPALYAYNALFGKKKKTDVPTPPGSSDSVLSNLFGTDSGGGAAFDAGISSAPMENIALNSVGGNAEMLSSVFGDTASNFTNMAQLLDFADVGAAPGVFDQGAGIMKAGAEDPLSGGMNVDPNWASASSGAAGGFEAAGGNQAADTIINGILGADAMGATYLGSGGMAATDEILAGILGEDFAGGLAGGGAFGAGAMGAAAFLAPIAMTLFSPDFIGDTSDQYEYTGPANVSGYLDRSQGFVGSASRPYRSKATGQMFNEDFSSSLNDLGLSGAFSGQLPLNFTADDLAGVLSTTRQTMFDNFSNADDEESLSPAMKSIFGFLGSD